MSTERRYNEEEIATIFEHAASAQRAAQDHPSARGGLTLDELQTIGAEVGISPVFVSQAVSHLDDRVPGGVQEKFLGLPVSASHTVEIPGPFRDQDWDRLVVDLRQTFQARGEITVDGGLREWRNGNLFASVEPTESGVRLRLGTRNEEARYAIMAGVGWFVFQILVALLKFSQNDFVLNPKVLFVLILSLGGLGLSGYSATWLRDWAPKRKMQMEGVAERALKGKGPTTKASPDAANSGKDYSASTLLDIPEEDPGIEENQSKERRVRE